MELDCPYLIMQCQQQHVTDNALNSTMAIHVRSCMDGGPLLAARGEWQRDYDAQGVQAYREMHKRVHESLQTASKDRTCCKKKSSSPTMPPGP